MVNSKSNLISDKCLRCCTKEQTIDHQAVVVKLKQAARSIELAIEICNDQEITNLYSIINCASTYLLEASDKIVGRK